MEGNGTGHGHAKISLKYWYLCEDVVLNAVHFIFKREFLPKLDIL